jgi:hypothetical protein
MDQALPRKGWAMEKGLVYGALAIAALMLLIFLLDMVAGIPFGGGPFFTADLFGFIASGMVAYLAFNAMRDLK